MFRLRARLVVILPKHTLAGHRPFSRKIFSVQKYSFDEVSEVLEQSILGKPKLTFDSPRYLPDNFFVFEKWSGSNRKNVGRSHPGNAL